MFQLLKSCTLLRKVLHFWSQKKKVVHFHKKCTFVPESALSKENVVFTVVKTTFWEKETFVHFSLDPKIGPKLLKKKKCPLLIGAGIGLLGPCIGARN